MNYCSETVKLTQDLDFNTEPNEDAWVTVQYTDPKWGESSYSIPPWKHKYLSGTYKAGDTVKIETQYVEKTIDMGRTAGGHKRKPMRTGYTKVIWIGKPEEIGYYEGIESAAKLGIGLPPKQFAEFYGTTTRKMNNYLKKRGLFQNPEFFDVRTGMYGKFYVSKKEIVDLLADVKLK